eukprot:3412476-Pyramimonas_sp.AAC.1
MAVSRLFCRRPRLAAARRFGRCGGFAAMLSPSPPRRWLVAARRLGQCGGLADMLSSSKPRRRFVAAL